jgi:hypothetical protein
LWQEAPRGPGGAIALAGAAAIALAGPAMGWADVCCGTHRTDDKIAQMKNRIEVLGMRLPVGRQFAMVVARTSVKRNPPFTGNKEAGDAFRLWISRAELRTRGLSISAHAGLCPGRDGEDALRAFARARRPIDFNDNTEPRKVVITGLVPVIHVLTLLPQERRGWPGQARP